MKKIVMRTIISLLLLVGSVYAINAAIIFLVTPSNVHQKELSNNVAEYGTYKIVSYEKLKPGSLGVLGWDSSSSGYVNMLSPESVIYVDSQFADSIGQNTYFYRHESAHVYQKEMISQKAGGYPSVTNPWQSAKYYYYMIKLNNTLADTFPDTKEGSKAWFMTEGFEASADCFAQPYNAKEKGYKPVYLEKACSDRERRLAISLISTDKWFDPNKQFDNPTIKKGK